MQALRATERIQPLNRSSCFLPTIQLMSCRSFWVCALHDDYTRDAFNDDSSHFCNYWNCSRLAIDSIEFRRSAVYTKPCLWYGGGNNRTAWAVRRIVPFRHDSKALWFWGHFLTTFKNHFPIPRGVIFELAWIFIRIPGRVSFILPWNFSRLCLPDISYFQYRPQGNFIFQTYGSNICSVCDYFFTGDWFPGLNMIV